MTVQLTEKQERRKANERGFKRIRRAWRALKQIWPARDPEYLAWLRTLPCLICWPNLWRSGDVWRLHSVGWRPYVNRSPLDPGLQESPTEAAHTGPHGIAQKAPDHHAIPLCHFDHQEAKDAQGKSRNWFEQHGLDRDNVIAELNAHYEQERAA